MNKAQYRDARTAHGDNKDFLRTFTRAYRPLGSTRQRACARVLNTLATLRRLGVAADVLRFWHAHLQEVKTTL